MSHGARFARTLTTDVLVIGTGPLGSAFARLLVEGGRKVTMIDAGPQLSAVPGWHLKNSYVYQRDLNSFSGLISSHLHDASVPTSDQPTPSLDPSAYQVDLTDKKYKGFVRNNQNPRQNPFTNLDNLAEAFNVGGMGVHWTCAIPRENPEVERSTLLSDEEWNALYNKAEELLCRHDDVFDDSIRHTVVRETASKCLPDRGVRSLPQAVQRNPHDTSLVRWTGPDVVLGDELTGMLRDPKQEDFRIVTEHLCYQLGRSEDDQTVKVALCTDLTTREEVIIEAKDFVVCCGATRTPQLLHASGIRPKALGHFLCEQPYTFCQVVLRENIIRSIGDMTFEGLTEDMKKSILHHKAHHPHDPVPIPMVDKAPQVNIPLTKEHPYHCQLHRDAFAYGAVPPNIDDRLIVDLRWFGYVDPQKDNRVEFEEDITDRFGMAQPTFVFKMSREDAKRSHKMMDDMCRAAVALGGFLPGSEPKFMPIGSSLHMTGSVRMGGKRGDNDSVCDTYSKVWGVDNLWLGSNGVIPTGTACNTTLTSVALAVRSARNILDLPDLSNHS